MGEGGRDEEVTSEKTDTLFMTKMAAKWLKLIPH